MDSQDASISVDSLLMALRPWGKWQVYQINWQMLLGIPAACQLLAIIVLAPPPNFICSSEFHNQTASQSGSFNWSEQQQQCEVVDPVTNQSAPCDAGFVYSMPRENSIVTEWDLVCSRQYLAEMSQTTFTIGQGIGGTLFMFLADRWGRKWVCLLNLWAAIVCSVVIAFLQSPLAMILMRLVVGIFQSGYIMVVTVITLELVPVSNRSYLSLWGNLIWALSLTVFSGLSYLCRDLSWRYSQIVLTLPCLVVIPNMILLDESIRWLLANGKFQAMKTIVSKAAKINGRRDHPVVQAYLDSCDKALATESEEKLVNGGKLDIQMNTRDPETPGQDHKETLRIRGVRQTERPEIHGPVHAEALATRGPCQIESPDTRGSSHLDTRDAGYMEETDTLQPVSTDSPCDLMKHPKLRLFTSVMTFAWVTNNWVYLGMFLTSSSLAGNPYLNLFLNAVVEIPGGVITYFSIVKIGRKYTAIIFNLITAASLLAGVILQVTSGSAVSNAITALAIVGKFGNSIAFGSLFTYTPELFPTNLRSLGIGIASSAARVGGMMAPYSNLLIRVAPWLPGVLYSVTSLVCSLIFVFLPETKDKTLPQIKEDVDKWYRPKSKLLDYDTVYEHSKAKQFQQAYL
ncbi:organic cation transporter protein-like [Liolophura sinensis]|uniref:organic cation transporter protein-like n=1 Tax=Liolophura sinensis TaxID=3198878 RepID=UPI0031594310